MCFLGRRRESRCQNPSSQPKTVILRPGDSSNRQRARSSLWHSPHITGLTPGSEKNCADTFRLHSGEQSTMCFKAQNPCKWPEIWGYWETVQQVVAHWKYTKETNDSQILHVPTHSTWLIFQSDIQFDLKSVATWLTDSKTSSRCHLSKYTLVAFRLPSISRHWANWPALS